MSDSIADKVRQTGIVGAGGAGFPTHVKFTSRVDTVIANGAECEPLLKCDKAVMQERTGDVLQGLCLLAEATGAKRAVLALKGHYPDVVAAVRKEATRNFPQIEIYELGNFYPAGDEQVLVYEVTNRVVPEGGIPLQVGVAVNNVVTLSQVTRAVRDAQPVTRRPLTIAGDVARPLTCELPIGTPMSYAVQAAGGPTVSPWAIVEGGPMMGRVVLDAEEPITKRTSGVLVLPKDHALVRQKLRPMAREVLLARSVCCQCRMCTDLCPRYNLGHDLRPHLAMRTLATVGLDHSPPAPHVTAAFLCCLCGVCEVYACTLGLSPRRVFERLRSMLAEERQKNPHQRTDCQPHDMLRLRRVPLPRLVARLGLSPYAQMPVELSWQKFDVPIVRLRLSQHTGAPSVPQVAVGDRVNEGDIIGEIPEGKLGARLHASIAGKVTTVDNHEICIQRN